MVRSASVLAALLLACSPSGPGDAAGAPAISPQADFQHICAAADQVGSGDPATQALAWAQEVESRIHTAGVKNTMKNLPLARPDEQWLLLKAAAAEVGLPNWSCPAVERMLTGSVAATP